MWQCVYQLLRQYFYVTILKQEVNQSIRHVTGWYLYYDTNFKTNLNSKCSQCTITYNFSQSGYPWLPYSESLKTSISKQVSYFFVFVFFLFFGQSTTFWCPFIGFLHAVQLLPADVFLHCFFPPSGLEKLKTQRETEIQTFDQNLSFIIPQIRDWYKQCLQWQANWKKKWRLQNVLVSSCFHTVNWTKIVKLCWVVWLLTTWCGWRNIFRYHLAPFSSVL